MFRSIVISPNEKVREHLISALQASGHVTIARSMDRYPTAIDLVRALRAHAAELLFLDFGLIEKALETVMLLEHEASHVQIVAFHQSVDPDVIQHSMRAGLREFLAWPFDLELPGSSLRFATLTQRHDRLWAMFPGVEGRVANEKTIPDWSGPRGPESAAVG